MDGNKAIKELRENKRRHWLDNDHSEECLNVLEKNVNALNILKDMLEIETDSFDGSDLEFHTIRRLRFKQDCRDISEDEYNALKEFLNSL